MKKTEIKVGGKYRAKVSNKIVTVEVLGIREGFRGRDYYDVKNLTTGRTTTFKSAAKFRWEVGKEPTKVNKDLKQRAEQAAQAAIENQPTSA